MVQALTLAHLSDVHLSPVVGFTARHWNVKRGLGYLNWLHRRRSVHRTDILARLIADIAAHRPDHIAGTGDLVNLGLPSEYGAARAWLEQLGPADRVTVVPGNHDIYVRLRRDPGVARWADYMAPCAWGRALTPPGGFPFLRRVGPAALIGVNSAGPTPPFFATGRVGLQQLAALGQLLDRAAEENLIRVVLIHHPPLPGQSPARRALSDAKEVTDVLTAHGADLVLHGHDHADTRVWLSTRSGRMLVAGVASGSAGRQHGRESLARYNLIRLEQNVSGVKLDIRARGLICRQGLIVDIDEKTEMVPCN